MKDDESEVPKDNFEDVDGVAGRNGTLEEDEDDEDDTNKPVPMPEYRCPTYAFLPAAKRLGLRLL